MPRYHTALDIHLQPGAYHTELADDDVAAPCLRYAHAKAELAGLPVHYAQKNAECTGYAAESFDLVLSHIMLHETSKSALGNIVRESYRLLKPGGIMLHLDVPRGQDPFGRFILIGELSVTRDRLDSLERLLETEGKLSRQKLDAMQLDEAALAERDRHRQDYIRRVMRIVTMELQQTDEDGATPSFDEQMQMLLQ